MRRELPVRKTIRLKEYNYSQAGYYFLTVCVKDGHEMLGRIVGDDAHIVPIDTQILNPKVELTEYGIVTEKYIQNIDYAYQDVLLDKYVIMPNHIHMILAICDIKDDRITDNEKMSDDATGDGATSGGTMWASSHTAAKIPNIVRTMKILISKECGFSFWHRSYHDHIIRDERDYQRIWRYIDENPARWAEDCYNIANGARWRKV